MSLNVCSWYGLNIFRARVLSLFPQAGCPGEYSLKFVLEGFEGKLFPFEIRKKKLQNITVCIFLIAYHGALTVKVTTPLNQSL